MLPCRITQGQTGGGEADSGAGRRGLDPPTWADRREIVVRGPGGSEGLDPPEADRREFVRGGTGEGEKEGMKKSTVGETVLFFIFIF